MKESMKKLTVLSFYEDREDITNHLQVQGVIHPELVSLSGAKEIEALETRQNQIRKAIDYLESFDSDNIHIANNAEGSSIEEILDQVEQLRQSKDALRKQKDVLKKQLRKSTPWGEYNKEKVRELAENGISYRFYVAKEKNYTQFSFEGYNQYLINKDDGKLYFLIIHDSSEEIKIPFEEVLIPENRPSEINKRITDNEAEDGIIDKKIRDYCKYMALLKNEMNDVKDLIAFKKVSSSFDESKNGKILTINGWYPTKIEKTLLESLQELNITFLTSEPSNVDQVPIQLKNNRFSKLFEPITKIFQLPNYREFDLTPLIAVFYPIFFAYCLGDAGYGTVVLLISIVAGFTFLKDSKNIAIFGVLLGVFTMVMGVVKSGSIFGLPLTLSSEIPLFQFLSRFVIIPDDRGVVMNAFNVALMIGVIQILVGVASSALKSLIYYSWRHALPQFGKFLIITSVIVLFLGSMQGVALLEPYLPVAKISLYLGIGLVLLFHDLSLSVFKRIGSGLLPLFFIFTGILGDILSYVRLFALGVVSSVLGLVVNQIGMSIMEGGFLSDVLGIVFLIFGHSLNLAIAVLGSFVHPLRLTFVEFYNNANFEGGGIAYKPFKKINT